MVGVNLSLTDISGNSFRGHTPSTHLVLVYHLKEKKLKFSWFYVFFHHTTNVVGVYKLVKQTDILHNNETLI